MVASGSQRFDFLSGVQEDLGRESKLRMCTLKVRFHGEGKTQPEVLFSLLSVSSLFVHFLVLEENLSRKNQ